MELQNIPVADSPNNDAFEAIVELYYQIRGYITSAGKWFWVFDENKNQRGYQDIDVLAVGDKETIIVSVTSNLDDKVNTTKSGVVNEKKLIKLVDHFSRVETYLNEVPQYKWLSSKEIKRVLVYNHAFQKSLPIVEKALTESKVQILSSSLILQALSKYAKEDHLKVQNQMLRTIQLLTSKFMVL